ncbi:DUF4390 domain-containing protein [Undibacterium sp. Jales W-56]|uniref:DUF4390 domain-containing protein n=1 Tax=Undibacterium sp. Jales W-56 TaxID=2897325 RepID=UPI0021D0AECB|nr:DUF4390 domain-containing protein [Undibacterium sp. Jales W-56]MCU6434179.1 DUF4390 domain-containing protein [Undibacterium sp. Jales W-56]
MIRRFCHPLRNALLVAWFILLSLFALPLASAAEAEVTSARLESTEEGYRIVTSFAFELGHGLEDAITRGIPMVFTTEVELSRPRWYWFDEKTIRSSQTVKIAYNLWTRQYTAAINGSLQQNFNSLDDALALVLRPRRWLVAEHGVLTNGAVYNVAVRLRLDLNQLPKPFLINALNNSDWRLSSDWKRFTFKAEEK